MDILTILKFSAGPEMKSSTPLCSLIKINNKYIGTLFFIIGKVLLRSIHFGR
jgi:hypothetical protein